MSSSGPPTDRRQFPRAAATSMSVALRPRGRMGTLAAAALDYNRYGIAVVTRQALSVEQPVFLSLACGDVRVEQVVGIVHNCVRHPDGFRIGIRFRLNSPWQRDRSLVERRLSCLEAMPLAAVRDSA